MGNIENGIFAQGLLGSGSKEPAARAAKIFDNFAYFFQPFAGHGTNLPHRNPPSHSPAIVYFVGEAFKKHFRRPLALSVWQLGKNLVGVLRKCRRHRAHGFVVRMVYGTRTAVCFPVIPGAHEGVLHYRQLIGAISHFLHQAPHQFRRDCTLGHAYGTRDSLLQLFAAHPRNQILAVVNGLGQA